MEDINVCLLYTPRDASVVVFADDARCLSAYPIGVPIHSHSVIIISSVLFVVIEPYSFQILVRKIND